jgi:UDP-N-acetylmuramate--alanine ligase
MYNTTQTHIHFVGIGGIGMSGIAQILRHQGYRVSGCDIDCSQKSVYDLRALGCPIAEKHGSSICFDASITVLVYSTMVGLDAPEIVAARARGLPVIHRSQMLAELMRAKYSIAVAGAHGKTTTTSMISHILIEGKKDPTVIIGGHLTSLSSNAQWGAGDFLVAEADESDRSFLRLNPTIAVVTNIDAEHLDVYRDVDDVSAAFAQFLENVPFYGKAVLCVDDPRVAQLPSCHVPAIRYGCSDDAHIQARDVQLGTVSSECTIVERGIVRGRVTIAMPGIHNVQNALAAYAVARELEMMHDDIAQALSSFKGVDRRFTYRGAWRGIEIFDDYGHHPIEIMHTLAVARRRAQGRLIVAFQPHRYSRTHYLWNDFLRVFGESSPDHLIITDIYAAGEPAIDGVTSDRLVAELKQCNPDLSSELCSSANNFAEVQSAVMATARSGDLVLFLGAGKIPIVGINILKS